MRNEIKMDASLRRFQFFVNQRKSTAKKSTLLQKPQKLYHSIHEVKLPKSDMHFLSGLIKLIMRNIPPTLKWGVLFSQISIVVAQSTNNFYFSTPSGGKNVLITNKPEAVAKEILTICGTGSFTGTPVITKLIATLCDGSLIKALNGSLSLNVTTDPSLQCIIGQFNSQCQDDSSSSAGIIGTIIAVLLIVGCIYYCCCRKKSPEPPIEEPVDIGYQQEVEDRDRRGEAKAASNAICLAGQCFVRGMCP